jgi:hypothetical protein
MPEAKVMHVHKGSVSRDKWIKVRKESIRNHSAFMKKYYPDFRWYIFSAIYFSKQYPALWIKQIFG